MKPARRVYEKPEVLVTELALLPLLRCPRLGPADACWLAGILAQLGSGVRLSDSQTARISKIRADIAMACNGVWDPAA